ncbi:MAG TPA: hypothetical protein VMV29_16575 [Ktedonobacterales bacterium]|nr:hypothetical protein [Ktedonobacterales bacterium]
MHTRLTRWRKLGPALTVVVVLALVVGVVAVVAALDGAQRAAARPTVASVWQTLAAKPLHLARLAPGQVCAPSLVQRSVSPDYTFTAGNGPVYVIAASANGVFTYIPPDLFSAGQGTTSTPALGGTKVRWQIAPGYTGPVLIRGRQLDGPDQLYFNGGLDQPAGNALGTEPVLSQLRLMGGGATAPSWPTWVTLTRLAHPGCYAYQVDGASFSYTITFQAVSEAG